MPDQLQARRSDNQLLVTSEILTYMNCEFQAQSTAHTSLFFFSSPSYQFENMQCTSFICWALTIAVVIDSDSLSGVILFGEFMLSITLKALLLFDASVLTLTLPSGVLLKLQIGTSRENTTIGFQEVLIMFNINILKL